MNFGNIVHEVLRIYPPNIMELEETKDDKNCHINNFFFFNVPIHVSDNSRITFRKTKKYALKIRFLYKLLYRVQKMSP